MEGEIVTEQEYSESIKAVGKDKGKGKKANEFTLLEAVKGIRRDLQIHPEKRSTRKKVGSLINEDEDEINGSEMAEQPFKNYP